MLFGVGIPTCREGLAYPAGFANLQQIVELARDAERLGFDSLWGNDHLATPRVLLDSLEGPPSFYEPLVTFAYLAGQVPRLQFVVATIVAPLRDPVLLAKQVATLDQAAGGRFVLGFGIGAYREEFDAIVPHRKGAHRGRMMMESIEVVRQLTSGRRAAFEGEYYQFSEIEMFPRPAQDPLPIFISAATPATIERAATHGDGLILAGMPPARIAEVVAGARSAAAAAGRDADRLQVCAQMWVAIGADPEDAREILHSSQHFRRLQAIQPDRAPEEIERSFATNNLVGAPDQILAQINDYSAAGVDHVALIFLARDLQELRSRVDLFGRTVLAESR
jgi:probable F420-dependent oxidoreductase